jgi:GSH-dependent disulfide-bond oxidoreductase
MNSGMIKLYTAPTPNGRKVSIALEEMGFSYEAHLINLSTDEQFAPSFNKISPSKKIPAISDGDFSLFESGAILLYLARKSGKLLPTEGSEAYWHVMEWLMWQMGNFGPMLGQAHHFLKFNQGKSEYAEARYLSEAKRLYKVLDNHLSQNALMTNELSIADIAIWPWVSRYEFQQIDLNDFPSVKRWYCELAHRSAFVKGYACPVDMGPIPRPD